MEFLVDECFFSQQCTWEQQGQDRHDRIKQDDWSLAQLAIFSISNSNLLNISYKMRSTADPLLMSVLRAGVSHGYKRSETSPVALPHTVSPSTSC